MIIGDRLHLDELLGIEIKLCRRLARPGESHREAGSPAAALEFFDRSLLKRRVIDIGVTKDGLIVPVLRDAGSRSPADLRKGLDRLRADTASRTVPPEELKGATFTLSNFGMFGGRFAHLVVVPPQVAILGAGRAGERAVARNGAPAVRRVLPLSLTFDHRAVTGGEAARFLAALKADLERAQ
jgi:2-oxoisovalerate dehydrogenase E2 component (dihydrolipoyl transacylase)